MKKPLSILLLVVMLLSLVSCSVPGAEATGELITENTTTEPATGSEGMKAPLGAEKLWNFDLGEGFTHSSSAIQVIRKSEHLEQSFRILPVEFKPEVPAEAKSLQVGTVEYKTLKHFLTDEEKKAPPYFYLEYTLCLYWERDGFAFELITTTNTPKELTDDKVSPELAETLTKNPLADIPGYVITGYWWSTSLVRKEAPIERISISLAHRSMSNLDEYLAVQPDNVSRVEHGGVEYYCQDRSALGYGRTVRWATDIGLFRMTSTLPPPDEQDPFQLDLAKRITDTMEARPMPILSGKAATKKPEIKPDAPLITKLWLTDAGVGFECNQAFTTYMRWGNTDKNGDSTTVELKAMISKVQTPLSRPSSEPQSLSRNGVDYSVYEIDRPGDYRREVYWAYEGAFYRLTASTKIEARKPTLAVASPETAESLTKGIYAEIDGYEFGGAMYEAEYSKYADDHKETARMSIALRSPSEVPTVMRLANFSSLKKETEGNLTYLVVVGSRVGRLVWNTDIGLFDVRITPGLFINEFRSEDSALINGNLIKTMNDQLGAKPIPFPD